MEMVLQQTAGPGSSGGGGNAAGGCRGAGPMMAAKQEQEEQELRRGPWTVDEDLTLINYIAEHGEGRWNALARAAGLKRTGKSCRLRWLNYLRPDVKRGDFTADEQLLILDLHSRWGNRWSKIAAHLPGRTDNEIKNYWRTRVQKHAKQLNCDVNSQRFKDAMRFLWMPRLAERAAAGHHQQSGAAGDVVLASSALADGSYYPQSSSAAAQLTDHYRSPMASCSVVTSTSSSSCSRTSSDESTATACDDKASVVPVAGAGGDSWLAAQQQDQEFWSTASALQQLTADHHHHQLFHFQQLDMHMPMPLPPLQDLSGWVQGFSEAGGVSPETTSLWSLDDIWRMQ